MAPYAKNPSEEYADTVATVTLLPNLFSIYTNEDPVEILLPAPSSSTS